MFTLAPHLGMTVARLSEELGSGELTEWMVKYKQDPWGSFRDNWHMGVIASMYANYHRDKDKPPVQAGDFIWGFEDRYKDRETNQVLEMFKTVSKKNGPNKT